MKFENPTMNISMFEMENVATTASTNLEAAKQDAVAAINAKGGFENVQTQVLEFTF